MKKSVLLSVIILGHCFLVYFFSIKNLSYLNTVLFLCVFFLSLYVVLEIIGDIKSKTKHIWKYVFFTLHLLLLYEMITKNFNNIRMLEIFYLMFLFFSLVVWIFGFIFKSITKRHFVNPVNHNWNYLYLFLGFLYIFTIPTGGDELDKLVIQEKEELISMYLQECKTDNCDKTFYFTRKNLLEQTYRVRLFSNTNKEKCVSISNNYFDPNLYISKCGNKEIEVNYLGEKL